MNEDLQRKIDDAKVEGWSVHSEQGDRAVMIKRHYGSLGGHVLIALLTIWWSFGLGNIVYAAYHYFGRPDKNVLRAPSPSGTGGVARSDGGDVPDDR